MKIVRLSGGLANQMYIYLFYKYMESHSTDICYLDDSYYMHHKIHNGQELERVFNVDARWFRNEFEKAEWYTLSKIMGTPVFFEKTKSLGLDINIVTGLCYYESINNLHYPIEHHRGMDSIWEDPGFSEIERVSRFKGHCYFCGHWFSSSLLKFTREEVSQFFTFPLLEDDENKSIAAQIEQTNSVGIHIRRGDFVDLNTHSDAKTYVSAVGRMRQSISEPTFFIFSDDIGWCRDNFADMSLGGDEVVFVDINRDINSFKDMQLMSMCKNLIPAPGSTFSGMAAHLMQNPDKIIITPNS